ncbi:MAG: hypothetical protein RL235_12 [Chlamydiota bacterium]|jgi:adenosine deaminase
MKKLLLLMLVSSSIAWGAYWSSVSKSDLHLHLGGAYPLDYLLSIANDEQQQTLLTHLRDMQNGVDYTDCFARFNIISEIVNDEQKVEEGTYRLCRQMAEETVTYAEIRTGAYDFGRGAESYVQSVLKGIERATSDSFQARLILSVRRYSSIETACKTIDLAIAYKDRGVIGIDLSGDTMQGDVRTILPELIRAKTHGLSLFIHMGEAMGELDQELLLDTLHPTRIGHGIHLTDKALAYVIKYRIPVEVCMTSSRLTRMQSANASHPWIERYRKEGHPIFLCSDDPLLFSSTLSQEYQKAEEMGFFSREELEQIAAASVDPDTVVPHRCLDCDPSLKTTPASHSNPLTF